MGDESALDVLRETAASAAMWLRACEVAAEAFGRGSLAHNMAREQFAINYGAEFGMAEDAAVAGGPAGRAAAAAIRAEYGLPSEDRWNEFWPAAEAQAYAADVARARVDEAARAEALRIWERVSEAVLDRHGEEWRAEGYELPEGLPRPDWL